MPIVLKTHCTEEPGNRIRALLARAGRDVDLVEPARDLPGLQDVPWELCSYTTGDGRTIWCAEVERFVGPDVQYWEVWQLDERPTADQVLALAMTHADVGSVV